ncbi:MAG: aldose 1-epimerase family protein [Frankiaceae bacterium]
MDQIAAGPGGPPEPPRPPSGRQYELRHGEQSVTVVEVGGGIRTYVVGGVHVLDGYAADETCTGARGQTLVPWPNRVRDGRWRHRGKDLQLPITEPDKGNAIHGLLRWCSWTPVDGEGTPAEPDRLTLACRVHPQPGYPFALEVRNEHALGDDGLTVRTVATNVGAEPCPYALGFHPYLTVGLDRIDDAVLRVPGATFLPTDDRGIPVDRRPVAGTEHDFREPRQIGSVEIDTTITDLERDGDGRAVVTLSTPDGARSVSLWAGPAFPYLEIFTGDALPEPDKRRTGLGVEPMTAPPNALQTGTDLIELAPGESVATTWGITATS